MFSQGYIIDSQICVAVLYLFYILVLKKNLSHNLSRIYLLISIPMALIIPLLEIPLLPSVTLEQIAIHEQITHSQQIATPTFSVSTINYLLIAYLTGTILMMIWMSVGAIRLSYLIRSSRTERIDGLRVIFTSQEITAYSVFNYIFINQAIRNSDMLEELLAHEKVHIKLRHTLDLIFMSLIRCLFWFNPMVWHTGSLLRKVHEYQVDEKVIEQGYSVNRYINLLILSEAGISPDFASTLSYSLTKNRIKMLTSKEKIANHKRLALAIPVITLLMASFSLTTRAAEETNKSVQDKQQVTSSSHVELRIYEDGQDNSGIITINTDKVKRRQDIEVMQFGSKVENSTIIVDGKEMTSLPKDHSNIKTITINKADSTTDLKTITITTYKHLEKAESLPENITIKTSPSNDDVPVIKVDVMPKFRNGDEASFKNWAQSIIVYPKEDADNNIQGVVIVHFIIEKDGTLSNAKVLRGVSKTLDAEVLKTVSSSEKWTPGTHKNTPVRVMYTMSFQFKLS